MSQSAQPSLSKRLRLSSPSAELPNSVMMSGSPPPDPGGGTARSPAHQTGSVDTESLLLEIIQTETGAADLAEALKARRVRDVLKRHGVKIQAVDDIGYNSLPLELRDKIRSFVIADALHKHCTIRCRCCPRLAPYACIDSEWRDAVEPVTFHRLSFGGMNEWLIKNLELLERYITGNRRKYLQHICIRIDNTRPMPRTDEEVDELPEENTVDTLTLPIRQLFNCVAQWHECGKGDGNLHVVILPAYQTLWRANQGLQVVPRRMHTGLTNLPTAPQIVHFHTSLGDPIRIRSMLALLSRMPHLRTFSVLVMPKLHEDDQDIASLVQSVYNSLSQTTPNLESLEVKCFDSWGLSNELLTFCTVSFSFSQRLRKLSFRELTLRILRAILAPFSTASFNSCAPPPLAWPELTHFTIGEFRLDSMEDEICMVINDLMLTVGRAIRYMPRIQHLDMKMRYVQGAQQNNGHPYTHCSTKIVLDLQPSRHSHDHISVARLCVTHYVDSDLPEAVPCGNVVKLWEKSLSYAANAILEVQVASRPHSEGLLSEFGDSEIEWY